MLLFPKLMVSLVSFTFLKTWLPFPFLLGNTYWYSSFIHLHKTRNVFCYLVIEAVLIYMLGVSQQKIHSCSHKHKTKAVFSTVRWIRNYHSLFSFCHITSSDITPPWEEFTWETSTLREMAFFLNFWFHLLSSNEHTQNGNITWYLSIKMSAGCWGWVLHVCMSTDGCWIHYS